MGSRDRFQSCKVDMILILDIDGEEILLVVVFVSQDWKVGLFGVFGFLLKCKVSCLFVAFELFVHSLF